MQDEDFYLGPNGKKLLRPVVPTQNLPEPEGQGGNVDLLADMEMPEAPHEDDPLAIEVDIAEPEAPQQDDPLAMEVDIAEPEHGYAQSGGAVVGDAQARAPPNVAEKGIQTGMPGRTKATQTQKRSRDRAVQTKESASERAKARAEEQNIGALQKEVRSLKVNIHKFLLSIEMRLN